MEISDAYPVHGPVMVTMTVEITQMKQTAFAVNILFFFPSHHTCTFNTYRHTHTCATQDLLMGAYFYLYLIYNYTLFHHTIRQPVNKK